MREEQKQWTKKCIRGILISLFIYLLLRYVLRWLLPFVLAAVLAAILHPVEKRLEERIKTERMWKKKLCCIGVTAAFFAVLFAIAAGGAYLVYREKEQIWCQWCCLKPYVKRIEDVALPGVSEKAYTVGKQCLSAVVVLFLTMIASVRFLYEYEKFCEKIGGFAWGKKVLNTAKTAKAGAGAYLKAQAVLFLLVSAICTAGLYLMKQKHSILIGAAIGLCDALPFLGTGTVLIPWALWGILKKEYARVIGRIVIYLICSLLRNALEPRLIGHRLGVHPLVVMSSMYAGICIYGISGVILGPLSIFLIVQLYKSKLFLELDDSDKRL
ncbi:MAG: AI-2E family transporter [Lachnospiraceae bacterium]